MISYIHLENMHFYAYHGCIPTENEIGTVYIVNLRIKVDIDRAMETDMLHDTINYQNIYDCIALEIAVQSNLIEHVAGRIIKRIKTNFPQIAGIELKLSKTNPPLGGEVEKVSVEIYD